jgi:hypothetical protein
VPAQGSVGSRPGVTCFPPRGQLVPAQESGCSREESRGSRGVTCLQPRSHVAPAQESHNSAEESVLCGDRLASPRREESDLTLLGGNNVTPRREQPGPSAGTTWPLGGKNLAPRREQPGPSAAVRVRTRRRRRSARPASRTDVPTELALVQLTVSHHDQPSRPTPSPPCRPSRRITASASPQPPWRSGGSSLPVARLDRSPAATHDRSPRPSAGSCRTLGSRGLP